MKKHSKKRTTRLFRKKRTAIIILSLGLLLSLFSLFLSYYYTNYAKKPVSSPVSKKELYTIKELQKNLNEKNIRYVKITNGDDLSFYVDLRDGGQAILSLNKELETQISSLQLILSRLTIEGKRLKKLDFRFDKPVIELN
ncbi:MAG TPA: hypothetical protein VFD45_01900 [Patescibacteria group bacterium]|nr:hypothetical protein [Patescibacteria group bacterium]